MGLASFILGSYETVSLPELDKFIISTMEVNHLPGVAVYIIKNGKIFWSKGYGWSNIEKKIPMSPNSIQNIASVSKTITTSAIVQLWEKGKFQLDDDINGYLPFSVRNPFYQNVPISFRQLLTHTSSIRDGSIYGESYTCGDPEIPLKSWIKEYLTPSGTYFNQEENFFNLKPGDKWRYSNIGFGLIGVLIEEISGKSFSDYCQEQIFLPLDMKESSWYLSDLDKSKHAVPYYYAQDDQLPHSLLPKAYKKDTAPKEDFVPLCLYSFPNIADGLLRTSVYQLAHFLLAYINNGTYNNVRILKESTIKKILSSQIDQSLLPKWLKIQGLSWFVTRFDDDNLIWEHGGDDPGVSTIISFRPSDGIGTIVFTNTSTSKVIDISERCYTEATTK
jgi:CubicO group peptidase (beta-lactamase class C family)